MLPEDKNNEEEIFHTAIAKPATERDAYLHKVCSDNPELLAHIKNLIRAYDAKDDFLEAPPWAEDVTLDSNSIMESLGTVIGQYKLIEKIGEGGMAVVYMAEQEKPIHRKVALKIIKLGMDTKSVIARFEAERQALAMMDHPNIAKVLDAGATETGRPYFVMELVQGISITEYCDKNNTTTKDRLALFIQICHAVQHAHTKGIIHRDIKPSNVMVTHHDGKPVPKVIDFGIAKATNQRLTEKTLFTRYAHIIGTPAYMSPEQAELSDLDIDTRTDIYSLGVLLYELLTGTTPFSEEELRKAGYVEMERLIREKEPAKPSTKLSTLGETLTDIAKHRGCTPDLLRKAVRGDLDWIVMKSLEKDRIRRYETANSLAEDIRRHLGDEPVAAGPPSTNYRVRKFVRRHLTSVVFGLVFMTSLIIGFSLAIAGFMQASHQRDLAEANFRMAREAVDQMLTLVAEELPRLPGISKQLDSMEVAQIKQALLENALKYYEGFLEERSSDLNIRYETAHAYMRVGDITRHMNQYERAEETYVAAAKLLEELVDKFPNELEYHIDLALTYHGYGDMLRDTGRLKKEKDVYRMALFSYGNAIDLDPDNENYLYNRADVYRELEQWDEAITDYSKVIELDPNNASYWCIRAGIYNKLGQRDKAEADYFKAIELYSKAIELDPSNVDYWINRADIYNELDQRDKAEADYSKTIELYTEAIVWDPNNVDYYLSRAYAYRSLKQRDKAEADYSKAIELDPGNADYWFSRADVYRSLEQWDKALTDYSKAIELDPGNAVCWSERADAYRELGQWEQALTGYSKAIELDERREVYYLRQRARIYAKNNQSDKAIADYSKIIEFYSKAIELNPGNANSWFERAEAYRELGQLDNALADFSKAIELDPGNENYWYNRAKVFRELGQWDRVIADYSQVFKMATDENGDGYPDDADLLNNFAWFLVTCPSAEIRDGARAIEYANQACILTNWLNAGYIDTLAAAYAEAGDFESAIEWQIKAVNLLPEDTSTEVRVDYESRLKLYQDDKSFTTGSN